MRPSLLTVVFCFSISGISVGGDALFNEQGLRAERYRAPLPAEVPNGVRLDALQLKSLIDTQSIYLVDVQAIAVRPETADFELDWLPSSIRYHIPGSVWLPNVGYGSLDHQMQHFFERELNQLTQGDTEAPIVFYCVADCWMSWNAVQRAAQMGYRNLFWFPEGSDGWEEQGFALVEGTPQALNPGDTGSK